MHVVSLLQAAIGAACLLAIAPASAALVAGDHEFALIHGGLKRNYLVRVPQRAVAHAALNRVDDVGFALAVIDDVARRTPIDRGRVYATGLSNGSMMAYRLAGPGHVWPGGQRDFMPLLLGTSSAVIDANHEIWSFFSRFRRQATVR